MQTNIKDSLIACRDELLYLLQSELALSKLSGDNAIEKENGNVIITKAITYANDTGSWFQVAFSKNADTHINLATSSVRQWLVGTCGKVITRSGIKYDKNFKKDLSDVLIGGLQYTSTRDGGSDEHITTADGLRDTFTNHPWFFLVTLMWLYSAEINRVMSGESVDKILQPRRETMNKREP